MTLPGRGPLQCPRPGRRQHRPHRGRHAGAERIRASAQRRHAPSGWRRAGRPAGRRPVTGHHVPGGRDRLSRFQAGPFRRRAEAGLSPPDRPGVLLRALRREHPAQGRSRRRRRRPVRHQPGDRTAATLLRRRPASRGDGEDGDPAGGDGPVRPARPNTPARRHSRSACPAPAGSATLRRRGEAEGAVPARGALPLCRQARGGPPHPRSGRPGRSAGAVRAAAGGRGVHGWRPGRAGRDGSVTERPAGQRRSNPRERSRVAGNRAAGRPRAARAPEPRRMERDAAERLAAAQRRERRQERQVADDRGESDPRGADRSPCLRAGPQDGEALPHRGVRSAAGAGRDGLRAPPEGDPGALR